MELFERVKFIIETSGESQAALARAIGLPQQTFNGYLNAKRQDNLWPLLPKILASCAAINRNWLYFEEGTPLGSDEPQAKPPALPFQTRPIPVLGLASCGVQGWNQVMPISVSSTLPVSPDMVAVIAAGESMVPAGIAPGHICYCDPAQQVLAGDAAYVVRKDGLATIKIFLGEGEQGADWLRLQGWLGVNNGQQRDFFIDLLSEQVEKIAPVIFVRRRI